MKPFAYFLCALCLLLILISPVLILSFYEKLPEPETYSGILSLWHISGWRTGGSSGAAFLQKHVARFEAQNPRVFIEQTNLTFEEATAAIADGQMPDIISYPYGTNLDLDFSPLPPIPDSVLNLNESAYPYMCGGYVILVNTDLLIEHGIDVYEGWGLRPEPLLEAAGLGLCFDSEAGYSALPALALHAYPPAQRPIISTFGEPEPPDAALALGNAWQTGLDVFCEGKTAVLIASHRQLFEAQQRYQQGEAPGFSAYAIGGYTDMVQMIGITMQQSKSKQKACEDFASMLLDSSAQNKLEALGVIPIISGLNIYTENECLRAVYTQICENASVGEPDALELLQSLAMDALGGSEKSLKKLRQLLRAA